MKFPHGFLPRKPIHFLLTAFTLQTIYLLTFHHYTRSQTRIEHAATIKQISASPLLFSSTTIYEFGMVAQKVTALADLAQHYVDNPSLDPSTLNELVSEQFPWWNATTLPYYPWKHKSWRKGPFSKQQIFQQKTGIVISVADSNAREAAHLIATLRNVHKSSLPIDIAYVGDRDLAPQVRTFLSRLGDDIHFIDLTKVFDDSIAGIELYATKPFALLASRYPRTILMDADAVFFRRPDQMFEEYPGLRETGALFFHDRTITMDDTPTNRHDWLAAQIHAAGRLPSAYLNHSSLFYRRLIGEEVDAAVVCVDKSRSNMYLAMVFACWMNVKDVRDVVTWEMLHGEKETYWLGAELTGVPYSFEPWSAARASQSRDKGLPLIGDKDKTGAASAAEDEYRCTKHMVHSDGEGLEPLWANDGLWLDKSQKGLGLADWTHWFLGERIDKALNGHPVPDLAAAPTSRFSDSQEQLMRQKRMQQKIMLTQPYWNHHDWPSDARTCMDYDLKHWRELSPDFRRRLAAMVAEIRRVEVRYRKEVSHDLSKPNS